MPTEWITWVQAAELVGCPVTTIDSGVRRQRIRHRPLNVEGRYRPTLDRASVEEFAIWWHQRAARRERRRLEQPPTVPAPTGPPQDGQLSLDAATSALVLGCTPQWVCRLAADERIPATRRGRQWWFRRRDIEQHAAGRTAQRRREVV